MSAPIRRRRRLRLGRRARRLSANRRQRERATCRRRRAGDRAPEPPAAVDPALREKARRGIRPTRRGPEGRADDERDAAASRDDSDLDETAESHTELLARHLGAEIIAEEEDGA